VLKTRLLHPEILCALGRAGHGARVLIADGNYPLSTEAPATADRVFLNLRRGLVTVCDVLEVLVESIPIEAAMLMEAPEGFPAVAHDDYRKILPASTPIKLRKRHDFYAEVKLPATTLVIATGEARRFANILLTIGVVNGERA
jgi:L-fucose mutarotase